MNVQNLSLASPHRWLACKYCIGAAFLLMALLGSRGAGAAVNDCAQTGYPATPSTLSVGPVKVPSDLPVGSAIPGTRMALSWTWTCKETGITGGQNWLIMTHSSWSATAVSGLANVYQPSGTSPAAVTGIGFRFLDAAGQSVSFGRGAYANEVNMGEALKGQTSFRWNGYIELVKTASTVADGNSSLWFYTGVPAQVWGNNDQEDSKWTYNFNIKSTAGTCSVTNQTQTVTLPTVSTSAVSAGSLGSQGTGATPFTISLKCSAGSKLYMTMTDATNSSNTSKILSLASTSSASPQYGLAIRRAGDTSDMGFGPDSAAAGATNQILIGNTPDGSLPINFNVRYTWTAGTASLPAGPVNAKATFTLSYQ